jgi:hypothetical protein
MNCPQAQEAILLGDNSSDPVFQAELRRHIAQCAECQAISQRLNHLETIAAQLPTPGSADAKTATLQRLRTLEIPPTPRRLVLRPMFLSAVAALLIVGVALGLYFHSTNQPTPPTVVDRLIDWNLELADAPTTQQSAIFTARAAVLQSEAHDAALSQDDRELASTLLEHGTWLCVNNDPIDRAEKFSDLSDLILLRMHRAAANNDLQALERLSHRYNQIVRSGVGRNLARLSEKAKASPEIKKKLERIARRNAEQERKLEILNARASKALQKELRQALETSKRQGRNLNFKAAGRTF